MTSYTHEENEATIRAYLDARNEQRREHAVAKVQLESVQASVERMTSKCEQVIQLETTIKNLTDPAATRRLEQINSEIEAANIALRVLQPNDPAATVIRARQTKAFLQHAQITDAINRNTHIQNARAERTQLIDWIETNEELSDELMDAVTDHNNLIDDPKEKLYFNLLDPVLTIVMNAPLLIGEIVLKLNDLAEKQAQGVVEHAHITRLMMASGTADCLRKTNPKNPEIRQAYINSRAKLAAAIRAAMPSEENECCICMNASDLLFCTLPCKHTFHRRCIGRWISTNRTCPTCRAEVK